MNIHLSEPDLNFDSAKKLIQKSAESEADVIVLPEMWNTGFFPKDSLNSLCDTDGQRVKTEIGSLAERLNVNIVAGSVANIRNGKIFNTSYVFDRNGDCIAEYDKTHLFSPMDEDKFFEKGNHLCCFKLDGIDCGIVICYDLRFPELIRSLAVKGIDILFIVSQWPKERINHLFALTKARAIENQMFVVCCNSCGTAYDTVFGGKSCVVDPWGELIIKAGVSEEIITAECDLSVLKNIREKINVFADRRKELYDIN